MDRTQQSAGSPSIGAGYQNHASHVDFEHVRTSAELSTAYEELKKTYEEQWAPASSDQPGGTHISQDSTIGPDTLVHSTSIVCGGSEVADHAAVVDAIIAGDCHLSGDSKVLRSYLCDCTLDGHALVTDYQRQGQRLLASRPSSLSDVLLDDHARCAGSALDVVTMSDHAKVSDSDVNECFLAKTSLIINKSKVQGHVYGKDVNGDPLVPRLSDVFVSDGIVTIISGAMEYDMESSAATVCCGGSYKGPRLPRFSTICATAVERAADHPCSEPIIAIGPESPLASIPDYARRSVQQQRRSYKTFHPDAASTIDNMPFPTEDGPEAIVSDVIAQAINQSVRAGTAIITGDGGDIDYIGDIFTVNEGDQ